MRRFTGNTSNTRLVLATICVAQFVVVLDVTIVTTALPAIARGLGFGAAGLPWVMTAYTLVLGGLLVAGGRFADVVGARKAFIGGLAWFALASAGCAVAWSPATLIGARALQGVGAALLAPAGLALLTATTEDGPVRRRAVGWWAAAAASGGASGWVLGGVLTEYLGWRAVFVVIGVVAGLAVAVAAPMLPDAAKTAGGADLVGAALATAALGSAVYALTLRNALAGGLAIALAAGLIWHLQRSSAPLIPPKMLCQRTIAGANLTALSLTATTSSAMYLAVLVVQQYLSPAKASLTFPAFNLAVIVGSLVAPTLLRRFGPRTTLLGGFAVIAGGASLLVTIDGLAIVRLLVSFAAMGAGLGAASVASTHSGTEAAETAYQGVSAGVLNSSAQIGTSFGLALVAPLAGQRIGFVIAAALTLIGFTGALLVKAAHGDSIVRVREKL